MTLFDKYGRRITDLRLSVTDRCNYKCVYCRTGEVGAQFAELSVAEYAAIVRLFASLGIRKVRVTGGEPLLKAGLIDLVRDIAALRNSEGDPLEIAVTTNGHLLAEMAEPLRDAGLRRVTVSMDAVDAAVFERITRVPNSFSKVLAGVRAARRAGLDPVKINCVLLRGFNEHQIVPFAQFARDEGVVVRFIEFMPLEEDRVWSPEIVVPLREIVDAIGTVYPIREVERAHGETARRFAFADGLGEFGVIAPVSDPFCGQCSRVRLTSDGKIRTCLFSVFEHDLAGRMRRGDSFEELQGFVVDVVNQKEARHHIGEPGFVPASRTMVHIGG